MDIISGLTDDQKALAGCFVAFVTCSAIMLVSVYFRKDRSAATRIDEFRGTESKTRREQVVRPQTATHERSDRKAA